MEKTKQRQINRIELEEKESQIAERIKSREDKYLLETYNDLKEIINLNRELYGDSDLYSIGEKLNLQPSFIRYILSLDELKDKQWLKKLNLKPILYVLNFNKETLEDQDNILQRCNNLNLSLEKLKLYIFENYSIENTEAISNYSHLLYERLRRDLIRIKLAIKKGFQEIKQEEKKELIKMTKETLSALEKLGNEK